MFSNILYPVDFSAHSTGMVDYVASVARRFRSRVTLLHALGETKTLGGSGEDVSLEWWNWLCGSFEEKLAAFGSPQLDTFVDHRVVEPGDAAADIVSYVNNASIDLIMMPTRGTGFRRFLPGSVTTKVLHDCACPVWTMTHADSSAVHPPAEIRNILCAVEFTSEDARIFSMAREIAGAWDAKLHVVHAVETPPIDTGVYLTSDFPVFLEDIAKQQLSRLQQQTAVATDTIVETGDPATIIRDAALDCSADLVVLGRGCIAKSFGLLRSHIGGIIQKSPCPVLSL